MARSKKSAVDRTVGLPVVSEWDPTKVHVKAEWKAFYGSQTEWKCKQTGAVIKAHAKGGVRYTVTFKNGDVTNHEILIDAANEGEKAR